MSETIDEMRTALLDAIANSPVAQTRYAKFAEYEQKMCLEWAAAAPTEEWRVSRVRDLAEALMSYSFDPMYYLGHLTFFELSRLYGRPRYLAQLTLDEQEAAIAEGRALEGFHTRNYDDAQVVFGLVEPGSQRQWGWIVAYARPCALKPFTLDWLDYNAWDTIPEADAFICGKDEIGRLS